MEETKKNVFKNTIYEKYEGRKKEIQQLILELVREHNNKPTTKIKLKEKCWSIPFWMNEKVETYFDCN